MFQDWSDDLPALLIHQNDIRGLDVFDYPAFQLVGIDVSERENLKVKEVLQWPARRLALGEVIVDRVAQYEHLAARYELPGGEALFVQRALFADLLPQDDEVVDLEQGADDQDRQQQ